MEKIQRTKWSTVSVCLPVYSCVCKNNIGWCMCIHAHILLLVYIKTQFQQHLTHYILVHQMATWKDSLRTPLICCLWKELKKTKSYLLLKNQHFHYKKHTYFIINTTTDMSSHTLDSAVMVSIAELCYYSKWLCLSHSHLAFLHLLHAHLTLISSGLHCSHASLPLSKLLQSRNIAKQILNTSINISLFL